jgi:hypothetical protein
LREEHRLRVFENRVLRKISGPRRDEDGSWRKLHNDELHNLYSSPNIVRAIKSRRMRWAGHVARMGEGRGVYRVLVREWRYSSTHSLTSAIDGGEWSASRAGRFTPREGAPGTHWLGGWVGPRDVLGVVVKRKIPNLTGNGTLEPRFS